MNVLLIVITLLMILTGITYTRLDTFRGMITQRTEYENYISNTSRKDYNDAQIKLHYGNTYSPQQLNVAWILQRGKNNDITLEEVERHKLRFKLLIDSLYSKASFYIDAKRTKPDFTDQLVTKLLAGVDRLRDESVKANSSFRTEFDLAKIPIDDAEMLRAFHLMLKGTNKKVSTDYNQEKDKRVQLPEGAYYSLIDFVNYKNEKTKVSSASPEILDLFFEPDITNKVIELRVLREKATDATEKARLQQQINAFKNNIKSGFANDIELQIGEKQ